MSRRIKLLLLVALLAGSLTACTIVKGAPRSVRPTVPRTTAVPGETAEPSEIGLRAIIEVPATLPTGEVVNLRFTLPLPLSFEPRTYRDEQAGFEFDYPRSWSVCFQEKQSRGYGANFCASSADQPNLSITVALWEPNNLDGYAGQRERAWVSSGSTIECREEWMLDGDHRAIRYLIKGREGERELLLITAVGEHYLTLAGRGDLGLLAEIADTVRFLEPIKPASAEQTVETGPNLDITPARQALEAYFSLLHEGRYAEAVAYYGGDVQLLRDWNPTVASDDLTRLLENGCTINGLRCLALKEVVDGRQASPNEYRFTVEFATEDGSTFVGPAATKQFVYTVLKVNGRFLVQELPPYVP